MHHVVMSACLVKQRDLSQCWWWRRRWRRWWWDEGDECSALFVWLFHIGLVAPTVWAIPLALGLCTETDTRKVIPLNHTAEIVTPNHLSVRHIVTRAVCLLVGVNLEIEGGIGTVGLFLGHFPLLLFLGGLLLLFLGKTGIFIFVWVNRTIDNKKPVSFQYNFEDKFATLFFPLIVFFLQYITLLESK